MTFLNVPVALRVLKMKPVAVAFLAAFGALLLNAVPGTVSTPANAAPKTAYQPQLEGEYSVLGRNPDGSPYQGRVTITVKNGVAFFRWQITGETYHGQGPLNGNSLVIDWGDADPVIYRINADGSLSGTWSRGRASETLRPIN